MQNHRQSTDAKRLVQAVDQCINALLDTRKVTLQELNSIILSSPVIIKTAKQLEQGSEEICILATYLQERPDSLIFGTETSADGTRGLFVWTPQFEEKQQQNNKVTISQLNTYC